MDNTIFYILFSITIFTNWNVILNMLYFMLVFIYYSCLNISIELNKIYKYKIIKVFD
jgi:hypothetical protein